MGRINAQDEVIDAAQSFFDRPDDQRGKAVVRALKFYRRHWIAAHEHAMPPGLPDPPGGKPPPMKVV